MGCINSSINERSEELLIHPISLCAPLKPET
jgi:hypothetical protein